MLPVELLAIILSFIKRKYAFSLVCKEFNTVFNENVKPTAIQIRQTFMRKKSSICTLKAAMKGDLVPEGNFVLTLMCKRGNYEMVRALLEDGRFSPSSSCIVEACKKGHTKIVALLLKYTKDSPKFKKNVNLGLDIAAKKGYGDIVKLLLTIDCVKIEDSMILAMICGHYKIAETLIKDNRLSNRTIVGALEFVNDVRFFELALKYRNFTDGEMYWIKKFVIYNKIRFF